MKWNNQVATVMAGIALLIVLYFVASNKPPQISAFDALREKIMDTATLAEADKIQELEKSLSKAKGTEQEKIYSDLAHAWEHAGYYQISGDYLRQKADAYPSYENYMEAGQALFKALGTDTTETMQVNMVYGARYSFERAEELQPGDINAKIGLATVLVQGTNEPMKGIMILREIAEQDPGNVQANIELGRFSMMSGQFDKAIERFTAVLQKDSLHLQSRYFLAEGYLGMRDTISAINTLENIIKIEKDTTVQNRIRLYINYLKKP